MPRGSNHLLDDKGMRRLYREFDMEDLVRIVSWMREIEERVFTIKQVCALSNLYTGGVVSMLYQSGGQWGVSRVRRVLRVGVEIGWLRDNGRARSFVLTDHAMITLPPSLREATRIARELDLQRSDVIESQRNSAKIIFERNK